MVPFYYITFIHTIFKFFYHPLHIECIQIAHVPLFPLVHTDQYNISSFHSHVSLPTSYIFSQLYLFYHIPCTLLLSTHSLNPCCCFPRPGPLSRYDPLVTSQSGVCCKRTSVSHLVVKLHGLYRCRLVRRTPYTCSREVDLNPC